MNDKKNQEPEHEHGSDITIDNETTADEQAPETGEAGELEQLKEELAATKDKLLRKVAELDNFVRRTRDEQSNLVKFSNEGLILELLPVLDDFDRSLEAGKEHHDFDGFFKGVELLRNKFSGILERRGLKPVDTDGKEFDENYHEAILQVPGTGKDPGAIIDEVEKGYTLHDKVIRHSKVTVASEE